MRTITIIMRMIMLSAFILAVAIIAFGAGRQSGTRQEYLLNATSHLLLLLDFREQMSRLPMEKREAYGIQISKYDALIVGHYYSIIADTNAVEKALLRNGNSHKSIESFRRKLQEAKDFAASASPIKIEMRGRGCPKWVDANSSDNGELLKKSNDRNHSAQDGLHDP